MTRRPLVGVWRDAIRDSELDRAAKQVALVISTFMNGSGSAFPAKSTIAIGCGFNSVRTVDSAINRLEDTGYLIVGRSRGGRTYTNTYFAFVPTPHPDAGLFAQNPAIHNTKPRNPQQKTPHPRAGESAFKAHEVETRRTHTDVRVASLIVENCARCGTSFETDDVDAALCPGCLGREA